MSTNALLAERGTTHGKFSDNAYYGQTLRLLFRQSKGWVGMTVIQQEALDMIACKLSRILSGQASHTDHWEDIAGYAKLAVTAYRPGYDERQMASRLDAAGVEMTDP